MSINLSICLKRASKIYHEGEIIAGVVVVESSSDVRHEGLSLTMEGCVNLQLSTKNVGIFEAFSNSIKPINLINVTVELALPGKIPVGITEIPFEMPLRARQAVSPGYPGLLETYHGVFVNIMYTLKCNMKRSFLNKPLFTTCQFFVQYRHQERPVQKGVRCEMSGASVRAAGTVPHFSVFADLTSTVCALDAPVTGKIRVDECSVPIKSIELQLVRVETCGCADGYSRDATEIQNIQIGEGDVVRGRDIPLYMVLPRLFTCPTTTTLNFKIEFELNIAVIFEDDYLVTENFPILLLRCK
ncbi:Down syndrome critical region protein 3 isoform X2 [Bombyx mandarina]|uniref:Vacuolar protein sorting-associated protein 26C n=2 Tax=Bombyx TaxID=7090 RepID=A0A8R2DJC8_BOMMO|nr:vacuolar protein sorting 26 isoform X1 [Bombyx mori]XP_028036926.1 Down syndrome critical region protein 3 isoform X1 [Bombyx mandarina]XP_028036927.1 Down syndrome critical region protein 3 isoform X2 [Bombyx mandarina]